METKIKLALPATTETGESVHSLDLNDLIVHHPAATYYIRVESGSFDEMKISSGDILVVDRSIDAFDSRLVVAILEGEFIVRIIQIDENETIHLKNRNPNDTPLKITQEMDFTIWGVVSYTIHRC